MALTLARIRHGAGNDGLVTRKTSGLYFADAFSDIPTSSLNIGDEFYCIADGCTYRAVTATKVATMGGPAEWEASDNGSLLAASMDPRLASFTTAALASGTENWVKIPIPASISVTNIIIVVQTAGNTLTASQCFAGLYSISGTTASQLGITADQSGVWNSTGLKTMALASGPFTVTGPYCYAMILSNGTTGPILKGGNNLSASGNMGMAASDGYWFGTGSTGQTTMTASRTFAGMGNSGASILVGLS
jgi:hypothetical protein